MTAQHRLDHLLDRLRERGCRVTPQRTAIVRALLENDRHPSAEQLHAQIAAHFPTTSLATVYKTIALLKDEGEVLELGFGEYGNRYDGRRPFPHPHVICQACGEILDSDLDGLDELVGRLAAKAGYRVASHRFDVFGLCPRCQEREITGQLDPSDRSES